LTTRTELILHRIGYRCEQLRYAHAGRRQLAMSGQNRAQIDQRVALALSLSGDGGAGGSEQLGIAGAVERELAGEVKR
jgi:hypothetical protein